MQALYGEMKGTTAEFKGGLLQVSDVMKHLVTVFTLSFSFYLQDIENQFIRVGKLGGSPFVVGIGNKDTDAKAYQMCNIRLENIFIVQVS